MDNLTTDSKGHKICNYIHSMWLLKKKGIILTGDCHFILQVKSSSTGNSPSERSGLAKQHFNSRGLWEQAFARCQGEAHSIYGTHCDTLKCGDILIVNKNNGNTFIWKVRLQIVNRVFGTFQQLIS